ncbi:MAG: DUF1192 domain-containing protein [Rhizomicrobium sp.]
MCDRTLAVGTVNAKEVAMDIEDLAPRKKPPLIQLGEDISALSAHELEARIARLEEEIARCKAAIESRHATKSAAESFFKRQP